MKISEALKKYRQELALSQKEFIQDIISPSQYSRIENGTQEINLSTALLPLTANHINVTEFIDEVLPDYNNDDENIPQDILATKVMAAYYNNDVGQLKNLLNKINKLHNVQDLKLRTNLAIIYLEQKEKQITPALKKQIINEFIKRDNWTESTTTLHLLEQSMLVFDFDQISLLMNSIFKRYENIQEQNFLIQDRVGGICINYLYVCYQNKNKTQAKKAFNLLAKLPTTPELFIYQLLIKYYKCLFASDFSKAKEVKGILSTYGLANLAKNLPY